MSSGSVPGPSRDSMMIYLLAGVAAFGGLFYVSVCACWAGMYKMCSGFKSMVRMQMSMNVDTVAQS